MKAAFLLGRVLFGRFFLYNGINHLKQYKTMGQYARGKGVPMAEAAVLASGLQLTVGGASLLSGFEPKLGAALIASFLSVVSPVMHDFWNIEEPNERTNQLINFSKNLAMLGAAAALAAHPEPWEASVQAQWPELQDRVREKARVLTMPLRRAA